jgi:hypothetical protein
MSEVMVKKGCDTIPVGGAADVDALVAEHGAESVLVDGVSVADIRRAEEPQPEPEQGGGDTEVDPEQPAPVDAAEPAVQPVDPAPVTDPVEPAEPPAEGGQE